MEILEKSLGTEQTTAISVQAFNKLAYVIIQWLCAEQRARVGYQANPEGSKFDFVIACRFG